MGIEVEAGTRSKVDEERQGQMRQFEEKMFVRLRETAKEQKRRVENRFTTNPFNIVRLLSFSLSPPSLSSLSPSSLDQSRDQGEISGDQGGKSRDQGEQLVTECV